MTRSIPRPLLAKLLLPAAALALVVPTIAAAAPAPARAARHAHSLLPRATGPTSRVIVLLRDEAAGMGARSHARQLAVAREEAPLSRQLLAAGATVVRHGRSIPFVVAVLSAGQRAAVSRLPGVRLVVTDTAIPAPVPSRSASTLGLLARPARATGRVRPSVPPSICGTAVAPESDPEAISVINSTGANALGYDGAGVTVAYIADGVEPTNPDFQRNAAYASAGSPAGSPVLTQANFDGDPAGTPTGGGEAFLDSSSIAAQGNSVYDLNAYVNPAHLLASPCDIKITGAAPGANVVGLDVFSTASETTESNFLEAIDYAVVSGVKVLNESFGSNNFPDTALDATRIADDDAVAAGVTVVVSSGDAGITSTIGSPATDPRLISVGASTTFRGYEQDTYGGINATTPNATDGTWLDNNISSLSSGGFAQVGGSTVDLVAPGDLNWALCDANVALFTDCTNSQSPPTGSAIELSGGTSESSPLTAGAAADVIQAYAANHGGTDPSPALVKRILMSTADDVSAPADQQGAGLLDVLAAVKEAASIAGTTGTPQGGLLISPNQVNVTTAPGGTSSTTLHVTNTASTTVSVQLSTRALTDGVATQSGSFCLNPSATSTCGPPTANTFQIWSGATEVYQEATFAVPALGGPGRLNFSADYPDTGQSSLLHVALIDPSGAYAGYSLPQGLADYANVQVANPAAGTWTAVFFTLQDGASGNGTAGTIQWSAHESQFAPAGRIVPTSLLIPAGGTATATFTTHATSVAGDTAQSIVLSTTGGPVNTVPVTVRTLVGIGAGGGSFRGVLTGGNGRGNPAQTNSYGFTVPRGLHDLDVSATFADANDGVVAFLVDPEGEAVASSSSVTTDRVGQVVATGTVSVYKDAPQPGRWSLVLDWLQPVAGTELSEPFRGQVRFNRVHVVTDLPGGRLRVLRRHHRYVFAVTVRNTGASPEALFLDPRTNRLATIKLADLNGSDSGMSLPLQPGSFPIYAVPTDTSQVVARLNGTAPVTFDLEPYTGDPDVSPLVDSPGATVHQGASGAYLRFATAGEVMPGVWYLNPSELGPYGPTGAPSVTATAAVHVVTPRFDPTAIPSTGDLWSRSNDPSGRFAPTFVEPGHAVTLTVAVTPTAATGTVVAGTVNLDDLFLANVLVGAYDTGADELASLHYRYRVAP